jgi:hypothetical protein
MVPLPRTTTNTHSGGLGSVVPLGSCKPAATPAADYNTRMMWLYTEVTRASHTLCCFHVLSFLPVF